MIRTAFGSACAVVVLALWLSPGLASANASAGGIAKCPSTLADSIPQRPSAAPDGSEFAGRIGSDGAQLREVAIKEEILRGNVPQFLL